MSEELELSNKSQELIFNDVDEAKWFVVHTYSGYEKKVKLNIEATVENRNLHEQILEVWVPEHEVSEIKDGRTASKTKKTYPGYVLIHMVMNDDTWYVVRNTRGVTGFVGPGSKPVPLSQEEVVALGLELTEPLIEFNGKVGDRVVVLTAAFRDAVGIVREIKPQKQRVVISIDLFGNETSMELDMIEVKKI